MADGPKTRTIRRWREKRRLWQKSNWFFNANRQWLEKDGAFLCIELPGKLSAICTNYKLTDDEYKVLRQKQTEAWNTGKYNDKFMPKKGYYACKGCQNPLYSWSAKYKSGCGWPAFNKCFEGSIKTQIQKSIQVEILCAKCGCHLGHVFRKNHYEYDPGTTSLTSLKQLEYIALIAYRFQKATALCQFCEHKVYRWENTRKLTQ